MNEPRPGVWIAAFSRQWINHDLIAPTRLIRLIARTCAQAIGLDPLIWASQPGFSADINERAKLGTVFRVLDVRKWVVAAAKLCRLPPAPGRLLRSSLIPKADARTLRGVDWGRMMHVPEGFAVVTPYIFANDADTYVRFLEAAFGAHEIGRSTAPNGRIANCQLRFGTAMIMVSEASEQFPASSAALYLYVDDADAAMAAAEAAGAHKIMEVFDMPYGDRQGGVRDPSGNIWWVSQRLSAEAYF